MPVNKVYLLNQTTPVVIPNGLVPKGAYNNATAYVVGDSVSYNGSSYVCILDSTGNLPTDTTYWQVLANKGDTGAKGDTGDTGATGAGVPTGGTSNQALTKINGTDYNTQWATVDKTFVGLGNVDNTSDANKPVSTAQATANNLRVLKAGDTMAGNLNMGTNKLIGGTSVTDILKLQGTTGNGTLTSPAIQLLTGNNGATTALTVLNNGNVGIGIATPDKLLHLYGSSNTVPVVLKLQNGYGGANGSSRILLGTATSSTDNIGALINATRTDVSAGGDTDLIFSTSAGTTMNDRMIIKSTGNVGIGTSSPGAQLQVTSGTAATIGQIIKGAVSQTGDLFQAQDSSGTPLASITSGGILRVAGGSASVPGMSFTGDPDTGFYNVAANRMAIAAGGTFIGEFRNDGLARALSIYGNTYSGSVNNSILNLSTGGTIIATHSVDQTNKKYAIQPYEAGVGYAVDTALNSLGGNVGIGVTAPSEKLEVSGNIKVTGVVTVTDQAYGAGWDGSTEVPTKNAVYDKIQTLSAGSGITRSISTVTSTVTLGATASTDYVVFIGASGVVTLPTAVSNTNRYTLKNIDTTNKTISTTSSQTIDGTTTITLYPNASVDVISDNTNWQIV